MKMKDTPLVLADWKQGMLIDEIVKKYELKDRNHASLAIIAGQQYNNLKGVNNHDAERTGRLQEKHG